MASFVHVDDLFESAWFRWLYLVFAALILRWCFRALNSLEMAVKNITADSSDSNTPPVKSRKSRPSSKCMQFRDIPPLDIPQTIPGRRHYPIPPYPTIGPGGAPRKPSGADGHLPPTRKPSDVPRKPSFAEGCCSGTPPCTGEEYAASVERLSSALRAAAAQPPFIRPAAFRQPPPEPPLSLLYGKEFVPARPLTFPPQNGPGPLIPLSPAPPAPPIALRRPQPPVLLPSIPAIAPRRMAGQIFAGASLLASGVGHYRFTTREPVKRWFL